MYGKIWVMFITLISCSIKRNTGTLEMFLQISFIKLFLHNMFLVKLSYINAYHISTNNYSFLKANKKSYKKLFSNEKY